ncbi:MAG: PfkB family carbohydrate kinase [Vicinamibacterales bacterium]
MPTLAAVPSDRARAILDAVGSVQVVVVGDVMLDHFMIGKVTRISPEAPVPVVELEREFSLPGGAANVAGNVVALGARVTLVGVAGDDLAAGELRGLLEARGVPPTGLITDPDRPTTRKTRLATTRHQQVARVDVERSDDVPAEIERALAARLLPAIEAADAVVVSDYLKGAITAGLMAEVVAAVRARRVPLLVDPKVPHLPLYAGATLVTPNHGEAEAGSRRRIRTIADAREAARELRESLRVDGILITLGEQGMWLTDGDGEGHLPATAREVADVTGAGDTVIATLGATLAAGATPAEAAWLATAAAGIVVTRFGTAVATIDELRARL